MVPLMLTLNCLNALTTIFIVNTLNTKVLMTTPENVVCFMKILLVRKMFVCNERLQILTDYLKKSVHSDLKSFTSTSRTSQIVLKKGPVLRGI